MAETQNTLSVIDFDPGFADEVAALPGGENIKKCFACGTCAAGCPVTAIDEEYNCRKIIRQVLMGLKEQVLKSHVIWYCIMCYRCYSRCPQKVNFTDIMRALRYLAVKHNYVPEEILKKSKNIDQHIQTQRHELVEKLKNIKREMQTKSHR